MIKLLIEDSEVDVLQTERIVGEYAIAPIGNISKRVGARSITFKLPKTAKNRAVFESAEVPTSLSIKPYRRLKARLYVDGVDMNMLFFTLERVTEFYEGRVYGSNADFFNSIKDLNLADLDYSEFDGFYNAADIVATFANDTGIIFPIVDWNEDSPNTYIGNANKQMRIDTMLPAAFKDELVEKIFNQNGYALQNRLLEITEYRENPVIEPLIGTNKRDKNKLRYLGLFKPLTDYGIVTFFNPFNELVSQEKNYWRATNPTTYDSGDFFFADKVLVKYRITSVIDTTATIGTSNFRIRVITPNGNFNDIFITPPANAITTYVDEGEIEVSEGSDAPQFNVEYRALGSPFALLSTSRFEIYDAEILEPYVFKLYPPATGYGGYRYLTFNSMLPKMKQSDFLKDYLQSYGAIVEVSERDSRAQIIPFSYLKKNISQFIDWSGKLDFIKTPITEFALDYGRNNFFEYANDDEIEKPDGTDFNLVIDDENLTDEKEIIELKHYATESVERLEGRFIPNIKCFEAGSYTNVTVPRVLILNKETDTSTTLVQIVQSTPNISIGVNEGVPFCHFIDESKSYNLGFGNDLFPRYYSLFTDIVTRTKVIECLIRLNTSDIATFDFLRPVYIKELNGYFYVSKIKFEYTSNASSVCELVKLL